MAWHCLRKLRSGRSIVAFWRRCFGRSAEMSGCLTRHGRFSVRDKLEALKRTKPPTDRKMRPATLIAKGGRARIEQNRSQTPPQIPDFMTPFNQALSP
jgi:hypothetical protein